MRITRHHNMGVAEAKTHVVRVADELSKRLPLTSEWRGDDLVFRGTGVDGRIAVADETIEITIKLGLALLMMERPLRVAVEETLDEELARVGLDGAEKF